MRRDPLDRHGPERTAASFLASAAVHALLALLLFSVVTSSSAQSPESISGAVVMTVSTRPVPTSAPPVVRKEAMPAPHAPVVPRKRTVAALPRSAAPHPRVLHELSKFSPTAPPNPTPVPASSSAPNPIPTQAVIAVSPAPLPATVPTSVPTAEVVAVSIRVPPTAAPVPKPTAAPSQAPQTPRPRPTALPTKAPPATPLPEPTAIAVTAAPVIAMATPVPAATPGALAPVKIAQFAKTLGSPGPRAVAPVKSRVAVARPIQPLPATPRPAPIRSGKRRSSLNERLQSLIPTSAPSFTPAPSSARYHIGAILPTPQPEPTPPPDVLAATRFLYVENVGAQRWKQSWLGTAPEERYVKMYVTSVKRIGFVNWCHGWVLRSPVAGSQKWIVEPDESFVCAGHLEPFTPPSPLPDGGT